jgi:hypothetical protein
MPPAKMVSCDLRVLLMARAGGKEVEDGFHLFNNFELPHSLFWTPPLLHENPAAA